MMRKFSFLQKYSWKFSFSQKFSFPKKFSRKWVCFCDKHLQNVKFKRKFDDFSACPLLLSDLFWGTIRIWQFWSAWWTVLLSDLFWSTIQIKQLWSAWRVQLSNLFWSTIRIWHLKIFHKISRFLRPYSHTFSFSRKFSDSQSLCCVPFQFKIFDNLLI
jgi:hypothetical protein